MGDASDNQSCVVSSSAAYFQGSHAPQLLSAGFSMASMFGPQNAYTFAPSVVEGQLFFMTVLISFSLRVKISSFKFFHATAYAT